MESQAMKGLPLLFNRPYSTMANLDAQNIEAKNYIQLDTNFAQNPQSASTFFNINTRYVGRDSGMFDESREVQQGMSTEKRLKRMISNRESARRSRMRRKQQVEVLQSVVHQLQNINNELSDKVIGLLESNQRILQENLQLHEKVSSLQVVLSEFWTTRNMEESTCNTNILKGEASNPSIDH